MPTSGRAAELLAPRPSGAGLPPLRAPQRSPHHLKSQSRRAHDSRESGGGWGVYSRSRGAALVLTRALVSPLCFKGERWWKCMGAKGIYIHNYTYYHATPLKNFFFSSLLFLYIQSRHRLPATLCSRARTADSAGFHWWVGGGGAIYIGALLLLLLPALSRHFSGYLSGNLSILQLSMRYTHLPLLLASPPPPPVTPGRIVDLYYDP